MKDLLILLDGTLLRFAVCPFGTARTGDRADPGDGRLCLIREIFRCVDASVLQALAYAGEQVPEVSTLWRQISTGEGFHGG